MNDTNKTKEQLVQELNLLRQHVAQLEIREELLRLSTDAVDDCAIIMLDIEGNIVYWNKKAKQMFGYEVEEIIGHPFSSLYSSEDVEQQKPEQELKTATSEGRTKSEGYLLRKNKSKLWTGGTIAPLRDEDGNLRGFSKLARDMSTHKQKQEDKQKAKNRRILAEDIYINELRKNRTNVQIFLINGTCLTGRIQAFSSYAIILRSQKRQQLVQKGAIVSIRPEKPGVYDIFKVKEPEAKQSEKKPES